MSAIGTFPSFYLTPDESDSQTFAVLPGVFLPITWMIRASEYLQSKDPMQQATPNAFDCLFAVIRSKHVNVLKSYMLQGGNINLRDNQGNLSLIHYAITHSNHVEMLETLLESPALDIHIKNQAGETPLLFFLKHTEAHKKADRKKIVQKMLERGANVNERDKDGNTALMLAARSTLQIFDLVFSKNPTLFLKNTEGDSALMIAARANHVAMVNKILSKITPDKAAELDAIDKKTQCILSYAAYHLSEKMMKDILATYKRLKITPSDACFSLALLGFLIKSKSKKGADLEKQQETAIRLAKLMLQAGANIDLKSQSDMTPLISSVSKKQWDLANFFIQSSANCNLKDDRRWFAISYLIQHIKESANEDFEKDFTKIQSVYTHMRANMSPESLAEVADQMLVPLPILQEQGVREIRIHLLRPQAVLDLQSTHRASVHQSTAKSAEVLKSRYPYICERDSLKETLRRSIENYYYQFAWITEQDKKAYLSNIQRTLTRPIPGDTYHLVRERLNEKYQWLLSHANWPLASCQAFLNIVFVEAAHWKEQNTDMTLWELFSLIWVALEDERYHLTLSEKREIKKQLGIAMIEIVHDGGAMKPACAAGMFNAMVDAVARSGLIPGVYVLAQPAETTAIKHQLKEKLSLQAHFSAMNAENKMQWFMNPTTYESKRAEILQNISQFQTLGENDQFELFTQKELNAFYIEASHPWQDWITLNQSKRPNLEAMVISHLKGMPEKERSTLLGKKKRKAEALLEESEPIHDLANSILENYPSLLVPQFNLETIELRLNTSLQSLCDYTGQASFIAADPQGWVHAHWAQYYNALKQEDLNQLLPLFGYYPTGNRYQDLAIFVIQDRDRVVEQLGLQDNPELKQKVWDSYQIWLEALEEEISSDTQKANMVLTKQS